MWFVKTYLFSFRIFFKKLISKDQAYNKAYLVWFIDSMRLINASLDTHVNNLSSKICNQKCKHCIKFMDCPKCNAIYGLHEFKDDEVELCKRCKKCKKLSDYVKNSKMYMRVVIVILNTIM